jgi:hypothetical protein
MSAYSPRPEMAHARGDLAGPQPRNLVFFNVDGSDGPQADHSAIILGVDGSGHYRFIASRTLATARQLATARYAAILNGDGHFGATFVNARRL